MKTMTLTQGVAVCLATLFAAANANAQILSDEHPAQPAQPAPPAAPSAAQQPAPPAQQQQQQQLGPSAFAAQQSGAAPAEPPAAARGETGESDHDRVVGHMGVTYFGVSSLLIGSGTAANPTANQTITAPVLGIRYWLQPKVGIDAGIGLGFQNGSTTVGGTSTNNPSGFGLLLHAGVPLVLAGGQHYAFEIIPEANIGFASGSYSAGNAGNVSLSGFRLDLGARAGGEIHFGFMGVPQLSLVATVGLYIHDESWGTSPPMGGANGGQNLTISTSVQSNPWSIFTDNISAVYYF
jgi:hypothetical protein